jgi:hypothetical protein
MTSDGRNLSVVTHTNKYGWTINQSTFHVSRDIHYRGLGCFSQETYHILISIHKHKMVAKLSSKVLGAPFMDMGSQHRVLKIGN